jgi:SAM-dependent methyltransferase
VRGFVYLGVFAASFGVAASTRLITYDEARPILDTNDKTVSAAEWPAWAAARNTEIRARLARGDEDSIVNLWMFGTSFTRRPRVTDRTAAGLTKEAIEELLLSRLDDFVAALARPGTNERLQFARDLVTRTGINLATPAGRERAEEYLVGIRERMIAENRQYSRAAASPSAYATLFSDRGLSSDTRLTASFAIDKALETIAASGWHSSGGVTRVAIVGPGLDFSDKAEGYDFYPPQTIQPFAVADSLARLSMTSLADLRITTLDLSPRVNRHLESARRRAIQGSPYVIQLPLAKDQPGHEWSPDLVAYWQRFGAAVGKTVPAAPPPAIVTAVTPEDVNIIVERLDPLADQERFDLIVATNILVYYDAFDQALALANIAKMLKPGGFFLTNYAVAPRPPMEAAANLKTSVYFDRQKNGDTVFAYRKR